MTLRIFLLPIFFLLLSTSLYAEEQKYRLAPARSKLEFKAYGIPLIGSEFEVVGSFGKWNIDATLLDKVSEKVQVTVDIDTTTLDTGVGRRDKHLRSPDFFWIEKYPRAVFKMTKSAKVEGKSEHKVQGMLDLRGVKKEIEILVKVNSEEVKSKTNYHFVGEVKLNRQDFGMSYESSFFVIPKVKDDVHINFDIWLEPVTE